MERDMLKTTYAKNGFGRLPRDYGRLCQILMPRLIHEGVEFKNVTEITGMMAGHKLTPDQEEYFDLLCRLIEDYEREGEKGQEMSRLAQKKASRVPQDGGS